MAYGRHLQRIPRLGTLSEYAPSWNDWFLACKGNDEDGELQLVAGGNGIWLLILSLTWWARSLTSKSPASHHEDLVNAMHALENALENGLSTSTTS